MAHQASNASASAPAQPSEQELEGLFAKWQILDEVTAQMFAMAMASLIVIFTIAHWAERLSAKRFTKPTTFRSICKFLGRPIKQLHHPRTVWGITIHPWRLHIIFAYLGINVIMFIHDHPEQAPIPTIIAKRLGWLALCNMCLAVFLGLKNTPLSPLTGYSFEAVNVLHRVCGYTTVVLVMLHAIIYNLGLAHAHALKEVMGESQNMAGVAAGVFMVLIFVTAVGFVRRRQYEIFYAMHVVLVAAILIAVGLHRPDLSLKAAIITLVASTMWLADKSLRLSRWIYYGHHNYCTLNPLPDDGIRISMRRPIRAAPGSVAFLWIPGIRTFQRHPFTIVQNAPGAEFVVRARDGFTRDLYKAACKLPGMKFRAAVEGPYGNVPDAKDFDKVIIFAGGSGVTFAMSQALDWAKRRRTPKDRSSMDFVWTVRRRSNLEWFRDELSDLKAHKRIDLQLYVSGPNHEQYVADLLTYPEKTKSKVISREIKTCIPSPSCSDSALSGAYVGRPDVEMIVKYAVDGLSINDRVLVMGCGPKDLLGSISRAVREWTVAGAPSVRMHLEEFCF